MVAKSNKFQNQAMLGEELLEAVRSVLAVTADRRERSSVIHMQTRESFDPLFQASVSHVGLIRRQEPQS